MVFGTNSRLGSWHIEGIPAEHIVASAILYYESSSFLEDDGLAFRRRRINDYPYRKTVHAYAPLAKK